MRWIGIRPSSAAATPRCDLYRLELWDKPIGKVLRLGLWNDGMNRVGENGKGGSIWLGWFLYSTLSDFAHLADNRGEEARAANWNRHAAALKQSLERDGWDGDWYLRGYFDDDSPLGSASSSECRIDAVSRCVWSSKLMERLLHELIRHY